MRQMVYQMEKNSGRNGTIILRAYQKYRDSYYIIVKKA